MQIKALLYFVNRQLDRMSNFGHQYNSETRWICKFLGYIDAAFAWRKKAKLKKTVQLWISVVEAWCFWAVSRPIHHEALRRLMASMNKTSCYIETLHQNLKVSLVSHTQPKYDFPNEQRSKSFCQISNKWFEDKNVNILQLPNQSQE